MNCLSRSRAWDKELCSQGTKFSAHRERTPKHQGEIASLRKELLILCWDIVAQAGRNLLAKEETQVRPLGQEDPLEEGMAAHPSTLAWRIPCMEEPGGLQSTGSQGAGHD